jgi:hypothetical protein
LLTRGWLQHVSAYIGHLQVYYRDTKCLLKLQRIRCVGVTVVNEHID